MRNMSLLRKTLFTGGVMLALGSAPYVMAQPAAMQDSAASTNETVPGKANDGWITTKVKSQFAAAKGVKATDFSVTTTDGAVTLTGTANSAAERDRAVSIAKKVKGVKTVDASGVNVGGSN